MSKIIRLSPLPRIPSPPWLKYYDSATAGHFWIDWRLTVFLHQLSCLHVPIDAAWRGLDAGCGNGVVRRQLAQSTGWIIDGVDIIEQALGLNPPLPGRLFLYNLLECRREFHALYDFIVLFDILEHIEEPMPFLQAILYHLKPSGWLFINVPALPMLFSRYDTAQQHFRRYTRAMIRHELAGHAADIRRIQYWGMSLLPFTFMRRVFLSDTLTNSQILEQGFNPPRTWMHAWLKMLMKSETMLLKKPPLGTSLMVSVVKRQEFS